MCACEAEFATRFLPHQLDHAQDLETAERLPVTLGFVSDICRECRGLDPTAHPKAELHGDTSKVRRYYWREIFFETMERFASWAGENGIDVSNARREHGKKWDAIRAEVIEEIHAKHKTSPKYDYDEPSASEIINRHDVDVIDLEAEYIGKGNGRQLVTQSASFESPEQLAAHHLKGEGFEVMECESRPFHVLFGVYLWILIQDPSDERAKMMGFGARDRFEAGEDGNVIWTLLPTDFGRPGYAERRRQAIEEHFELLQDDLEWLFDYWLEPSLLLRQYLWAHRDDDVARARRVIEMLPSEVVRRILKYLVGSYWKRYVGWPDLLGARSEEYVFAEVKGSGDSLTLDQKRWIRNNDDILGLPFRLIKIHRRPEPW